MADRQTVLVAGANGNIGGGAAEALARRGARVVLVGRNEETLAARADRIRAALADDGAPEPIIETLAVDLADIGATRQAATEALERFPAIDGLVLSVGALLQGGPTIGPRGHEAMFATNVLGPFALTCLLLERLQRSEAVVLRVIAPFYEAIDWNDLESIEHHDTDEAYHRSKTMDRMMAAELARRHGDTISSVAFDPSFIIDKHDPTLKDRWPSGFTGFYWRVFAAIAAKPPRVAGEPIADLVLAQEDPRSSNGALYKLGKRTTKPDRAMADAGGGRRLWDELVTMVEADTNEDPLRRRGS